MILARALEPTPDLCCLPSPHKVPHGVAGMAFNFSKIEVAHHPSLRKASRPAKPQAKSTPHSAARS